MAGELRHRGPEGVGLYLDGPYGMANTRLSIIDIDGGDQPISNEDGRYWVVQNGEIFNYPELRDELAAKGHRFATASDTEVIAHAYEEWGEGCLERFEGEFAFAVWDRASRTAFLARDAFGIRPLFLTEAGGEVAFASEAKALLRHPAVERRLDPTALVETFTLWAPQAHRSAFAGIRELPPGHCVRVSERGLGPLVPWWDVRFGPREGALPERGAPRGELAERLLELLDDATRLRLRADVPVGVYLSGGLDSSSVVALARRHARGPLHAFGVGFEDLRYDESGHQDRVAAELGVHLQRITVSGRDIADAFPDVVRMTEKPLLRTSPAPLYMLSRAVRDAGFKVVLTGEGADELFAGYQLFAEAAVRRFWARRPDSTLRPALLRRLYPYLSRDLVRGGGFLAEFFKVGLEDVDDPLYSHRPRFRTTSRNLRFLSREVREAVLPDDAPEARLLASLPEHFAAAGPLGKAQYLEVRTFLEAYLLHSQGDRMLMAHSVEGRFPFLSRPVAEFAARLPERLRMNGLDDKVLLRQAVAPIVPGEVVNRPKHPYRAPITRAFFGDDAPSYVREALDAEALQRTGVVSPEVVQRLVQKCDRLAPAALSESDEMGLVGVLSVALLHDAYVAHPAYAEPAVPTRVVEGSEVRVGRAPRPASPHERPGAPVQGRL